MAGEFRGAAGAAVRCKPWACGVVPVANAEIGSTFPQEKKGMALGIAAAVAGIANVLGAAAGSFDRWAWWATTETGRRCSSARCPCAQRWSLTPGVRVLPIRTVDNREPLDAAGSVLMVITVLLLLLALQGIDVGNLAASLGSGSWCWLAGWRASSCSWVASTCWWSAVRKARCSTWKCSGNRAIVVTMVVSFFVGCVTITMTLIPEVAEFIMDAPVGSGGLYILPVGVMCMFGPPLGGKLIDKFGPKPVLMSGLAIAAVGFFMLALASLGSANAVLLIAGLAVMGLGMGFAMGAPTNYMILENTSPAESGSAIATYRAGAASGHDGGAGCAAGVRNGLAGGGGVLPECWCARPGSAWCRWCAC